MNNAKNTAIGYAGKIDLTVKKGKKTVVRKTFHNTGNYPLYEFLSECIVDNNYHANKAPRYIRLFNNSFDYDPNEPSVLGNSASSAIYYSTGDVLYGDSTVSSSGGRPSAYLHFVIPASALAPNSGDQSNKATINQAALYSADNAGSANTANYSALVNFLAAAGDVWDPLEVSTINGSYTVFIDWTLSFETASGANSNASASDSGSSSDAATESE